MSQPRRRRRRRRKGGGGGGQQAQQKSSSQQQQGARSGTQEQRPASSRGGMPRRRRRRSGSRGSGGREQAAVASSEDLVRAEPKPRPKVLTLEPDGQTLEGIIGDLQSEMGIPQYPQEYRITIKVADDNTGKVPTLTETTQDPLEDRNGNPKREKAPAAPRIGGGIARALGAGEGDEGASGGRRRRRRRRGRGGRGRRGGGGGGAPAGGQGS